jgi:hypothetical protein
LFRRLVLGSLLALALGVLIGIPVLFKTVTFGEPPRLYADVIYAYFSLLPSNQSVSGLRQGHFVSFLFVLNVTNLSNEVVEITSVNAEAAEKIKFSLPNTNETVNANKSSVNITNTVPLNVEWSNATQVQYMSPSGIGYQSSPSIAALSESFEGSLYYWAENASRLVALSGLAEVTTDGLTALQNSKIFVLSHVEGKAYSNGLPASGAYVIEGVQLEAFGDREFVFNELLKANEALHVSGSEVFITSGK